MDLQLTGVRALVTGGTRGIGRAIVEGLAAEGATVGFCARDPDEVAATEQALTGGGADVWGAVLDVGDAVALAGWVEQSAGRFGGLDAVVANVSALAIPDTEDNWQTSFNVDLMHAVRLVRAAMPHLERSDHPSIVTISSVSGREIDFAAGPYGTMKAALVHYTQGLAYQLTGKGIRANTVSPGNTFFPGGIWERTQRENPEFFGTALGLNPTGRMAAPPEIAAAVVFLVSPVSSFTTGAHLLVDGALTRGVQL